VNFVTVKAFWGILLMVLVLSVLAAFALPKNTSIDYALKDEIALGKQLFFDPILSSDSSLSCASCHKPNFAFADTVPISFGVGQRLGIRNAPSIMNLDPNAPMFYDGRARNLQDQVHFPIQDSNEMRLSTKDLLERLTRHKLYAPWFQTLYQQAPSMDLLSKAIAAYEQTLQSAQTPFDAYMAGDNSALNASAKRGRKLFLGNKAKCFDCHFGPDFTGNEFKNIGLYDAQKWTDKGLYNQTHMEQDLGKFKVPGLRNVAVTGPYMHNGQFKTLKEVIAYYANPYAFVKAPINMDSSLLKPSRLTQQEQKDLLAFLNALTDKAFVPILLQKH
jgi:cytochrome c peroxidase